MFVLLREAAREPAASRRSPAELAKLLHTLLTDDAFAVRVRAEARGADAAAAFRAACARLALCGRGRRRGRGRRDGRRR